MEARIPAFVGIQGLVSNDAALALAASLYRALAVGLSLDEALTYARLAVLDLVTRAEADGAGRPAMQTAPTDWLRFMAYMPAADAVLFPRPAQTVTRRDQRLLTLDGAAAARCCRT